MAKSKWRQNCDAFIESCLEGFQAQTVLDVGCGDRKFKSPKFNAEILGVDILPFTDVDFVCDLEESWPKIKNVDVVLMNNYLEHCFTPKFVLDNSFSALRPGGICILTVPFSFKLHQQPVDFYRYSPFAIIRLLENSGFVDVSIIALSSMSEVISHHYSEVDKHLANSLNRNVKVRYSFSFIVNRILIFCSRVMINYTLNLLHFMEKRSPSHTPTITLGFGVVGKKPKK